jgi:hypothetical protein
MISYKDLTVYLLMQQVSGTRGPWYSIIGVTTPEASHAIPVTDRRCGHTHRSPKAAVACFLRMLHQTKRRNIRGLFVQLQDGTDRLVASVDLGGFF